MMETKITSNPFSENKREKVFYISRLIGSYYASKNYAVFKEVGLPKVNSKYRYGCKRADILCINTKNEVIILETKSSYEDYKTDKKWQYYLDWCNKFYFVSDNVTAQKIKEDLKNKEVGIISIEGKPSFIKSASRRDPPLLSNNILALQKAIIFRASPFRANGSLNKYSHFYPAEFISSFELRK